ncbi:DNA topoisomerase IB [Telluribacter sp. SYSU D00476]|uniref:DNA topoisomerase IB n=1 Tax=Telluribacter sp. SYSU D00476 TaxID=2811430 RepID=UPI001FF6F649|nr:DNA topoisomerase IB [Telluribacter sp. SYSU D00476]
MSVASTQGVAPVEFPALTPKEIKKLRKDPARTAEAVGLTYVRSDEAPGYQRKRAGKGFYYVDGQGARCKDAEALNRIKTLAIPPAWQNVWISEDPNTHLQATGIDEAGRKQYRYHPFWNQIRNHTKYYRLLNFSDALPKLREQVETDLRHRNDDLYKVTALVIKIMEKTCIRVGNMRYKVQNGSSGITTLDARQVTVTGNTIRFTFKGKKGIKHDITLRDPQLARLVKHYKEMPGRRLFQYINDNGKRSTLKAEHVNEYIRTHTGGNYSAKDFRTWMGTVTAFEFLSAQPSCTSQRDFNRKVNACLDAVAAHLGNTRAVCRKYYVHPAVTQAYEQDRLKRFLNRTTDDNSLLSETEQRLKALLASQK